MSEAHHPAKRQLRAIKMGPNVKDEIRYVHEVRRIRAMREHLVHQLPQIFAAPDPLVPSKDKAAVKVEPTGSTTDAHIVNEHRTAIKVKPADPVKEEPSLISARINRHKRSKSVRFTLDEVELTDLAQKTPDSISTRVNGRNRSKSDRVGSDLKNETLQFFVALATFSVGFGTLFLGIYVLCGPSIFKKSGLSTGDLALVIWRLYMGTGLAMFILGFQKNLRALGTMLLCEAVAEMVVMILASNSGFATDFLVAVTMTSVKGVLGWWMINSRE